MDNTFFSALTNLWVGELQACDGEHDFSNSNQHILRDLPGNVHVIGFYILHLLGHDFTWFLPMDKDETSWVTAVRTSTLKGVWMNSYLNQYESVRSSKVQKAEVKSGTLLWLRDALDRRVSAQWQEMKDVN